jgi:hypothetical protein
MALPLSFGLTAIGLGFLSKLVPPDDVAPGRSLANLFTKNDKQEILDQTQETQQTLSNIKQNEYDKIQTKLTQQIKSIQYNTNKQINTISDRQQTQSIKQNASLEIQKLKENALRNATRAAVLVGNTERQIVTNASKVLLAKPISNNSTKPIISNSNRIVMVNNTNRYPNNNFSSYDVLAVNNYKTPQVSNTIRGVNSNKLISKNVKTYGIDKSPQVSNITSKVTNNSVKTYDISKRPQVSNTTRETNNSKPNINTNNNANITTTNNSKSNINTNNNANTYSSKPNSNTNNSANTAKVLVSNTSTTGSNKPNSNIANSPLVLNTSTTGSNKLNSNIANSPLVSNTTVNSKPNSNIANTTNGSLVSNTIVNTNTKGNTNSKNANDNTFQVSNTNGSNGQSKTNKQVENALAALEINSSNSISEEEMVQNAYQRAKEIIQQAEQEIEKKLQEANKNIKTLETDAKLQASLIIKKAEENAANVLRRQSNSQKSNTNLLRTNVVANVSKQMKEQAEKEAKKIIETAQANAMMIRKDAQNTAQSNTNSSAQKMGKAQAMIQDAENKAAKIMSNVNQSQNGLSKQFAELSRKEKELQQKLFEIQKLEENRIKETIQKAVNNVSQGQVNSNTARKTLENASNTVNKAINESNELRSKLINQASLLSQTSKNTLQQQTNESLRRIGNATIEQATASAQAKSILDNANLEAQRIIAESRIQAGKANKANANTAYDIIANANKRATEIQARAQEESNKIIRNAQNAVKGLNNSSTQNCSLYSLNSKINPEMTPPSFKNELNKEYIDQLQTRVDKVLSLDTTQFDKSDNLSSMFSDYNNTFIPSPKFNVDIFNDNKMLNYVQTALSRLYHNLTGSSPNKPTNALNVSTMGSIQNIIKLYIDIIRKLLTTPIMYKLTSLDADSIKSLIASTSIQLYDNNYKPINKTMFMEKLYKFLYIDITPYLFIRQSALLNPYYSNYTKQLEDYIIQDTENSAFVLYPKSGAMDKRSMFVLRFVDMISSTYSKNDRNTKSFNYHILTYIISIIPDLYNFTNNLHSHIENPENDAFAMSINMLLFRKLRKNVLTYIKIRNDDGAVYNDRFKVFVDNNKNNTLLVRYNDHNIPYYSYDNTQKLWNVSPTIKQDWDAIYGTPAFNEVFDANGDMLSVKGYSDEYLLGPFTQVFEQQLNNRNIADKMDEVVMALKKDNPIPQPVFLIGYGASGAGKTSSLVYFNKGVDIDSQNGILMHLCNRLSEGSGYKNIRVKSIEFYAKEGSGKPVQRMSPVAKDYLKFHFTPEKGFVLTETYHHKNAFKARVMQQLRGNNIEDFQETEFSQGTVLGEVMIHMIDNDRFVKATTNNPNSSRSHCLIFINFGDEQTTNSQQEQQFDPKRTLIVGDFAGVENLFNCLDDKQLKGFLDVKKDDGSGRPFYSEKDLSLSGQEGGKKSSRQLGGSDDPCVLAIQDTSEIFKLGVSSRPLRTNDDTIEIALKDLFDEPKIYNAFLETIYKQVVASAQLESKNPFQALLDTSVDKLEKYFQEYETTNIETLVNTGKLFVNVFKKFSTLNENSDDSTNAYEKLLSEINIEVEMSQITFNFKTDVETKEGQNVVDAYQYLNHSVSGLKITPAPFLKSARECITTDGKTTFLPSYTANQVFDNSFCAPKYGAATKDAYSSKLLSSMDNAESVLNSMKQGKQSDFTNKKGETLYLSTYSIDKKVPMKCAKISNKRFVTEILSVLNHPFFNMINIDASNQIINLKNIGKQFSDQYIRYKLGPFVAALSEGQIDIRQFFKLLLDEAKSIVINTACRMQHSTKVCGVRRAEGVFINNSLHGIREVIKEIMYEKNKNSINIAPLFHEPCLPSYCSKDNSDCFKLVKPKKSVANQIFEALIQELNPQLKGIAPEKIPKGETLNDLIVGVFCVLNLSRKANNPPPVPYINTNHIRFELSKSKQINTNIINECKRLYDKLQFFLHKNSKVRIELNPGWLSNLKMIITNEVYILEKGINAEQENALYNLLNALDNISAASAMGTLQFVDMMSKYNTTDIICSQQKLSDNTNLYNKLIQKLDLVDIVNKKDTYNVGSNQLKDHTIFNEVELKPQPVVAVNTQKNTKIVPSSTSRKPSRPIIRSR